MERPVGGKGTTVIPIVFVVRLLGNSQSSSRDQGGTPPGTVSRRPLPVAANARAHCRRCAANENRTPSRECPSLPIDRSVRAFLRRRSIPGGLLNVRLQLPGQGVDGPSPSSAPVPRRGLFEAPDGCHCPSLALRNARIGPHLVVGISCSSRPPIDISLTSVPDLPDGGYHFGPRNR